MRIENKSGIQETLRELGVRAKDVRVSARMTQGELAKKSGVSLSSIIRFEKGEGIQLDNALQILKSLNILSRADMLIPAQGINPMEFIRPEVKKKVYNHRGKTPVATDWEWGE